MSRVRNDGNPCTHTLYGVTQTRDGDVVWVGEGDVPYPATVCSSIADEQPRMARYGNCKHNTITSNLDQSLCAWIHPDTGASYTMSNRAYYADRCPAISRIAVDWDQLNAEAYLTMKPSLSSGFSLTNFLAELVEIKTMFRLFSRSKSLISNAASAHLNWEFGWKLFIQDLYEIVDKLLNWKVTLERYKSKQGLVLVRHFKKVLEDGSDVTTESSSLSYHTYTTKRRSKVVFHATMRYTYTCPQLDAAFAEVKAILDVFGLKLNGSVIWEAIPFSFVVDWFLGVGDYLASKDTDYLESKVTILDYCCSLKEEYVDELHADKNASIPLGSVTRKYYTRRRAVPNSNDFGVVLTDRFGSKQHLLATSLLLA